MAYSQADLDAVSAALARGAKRVRIGNEEVEYDLTELRRIKREIEAELGKAPARAVLNPQTSTGWR